MLQHAKRFASSAAKSPVLKLGFVGAGGINFGTPEGPWNHAGKIEKFDNVEFSAIVDPNLGLAYRRVEEKKNSEFADKWKNVKVYRDYKELLEDPNQDPDAMFIGLPPTYHGSIDDPDADVELQFARRGIHTFVEKPIGVRPVEEVQRLAQELKKCQDENGAALAVGYMLRYSPAVEAAKKILAEHHAQPVVVLGRYAGAYTHLTKRDWWDTSLSGGPIVEQATHFIDLMRHLAGDIDKDTIQARSVGPEQVVLSDMAPPPAAEHPVCMKRRPNRATTAQFRFTNGLTLGSLTYTVLLHEANYHTVLEVLSDGLHVIIEDPYGANVNVQYRLPKSNEYHTADLNLEHDMYEAQFRDFIQAVRTGDHSFIRSPYLDAVKTYEASRWITDASSDIFKA